MTAAAPFTLDRHLAPDARRRALEPDVRAGLGSVPRSLPPKWFYDARGSQLFDEITRLPEYYPFRAERALLEQHAAIAQATGADTLVELGSGTSERPACCSVRCATPDSCSATSRSTSTRAS